MSTTTETTAGIPTRDDSTLVTDRLAGVSKLVYMRGHRWGDKLLRRLNPDQLMRYLAENPYTIPITSTVHDNETSKVKDGYKDKLRRGILVARSMRALKAKVKGQPITNDKPPKVPMPEVLDDAYQRGSGWIVPGVGEFSNRAVYTFLHSSLPTGLIASDNEETRGSAPCPFRFDSKNVTVSGGTLNLCVPGGQTGRREPISCAEVMTDETNILHASVRMTARMSGQAGVCHGFFFYRSDENESDIEYLTDPSSQSNRVNPELTQFWYSNQANVPGGQPTHQSADPPPVVEGYHTYRLDWTANFTAYYVDGKLQSKLTDNVPNKSGMWVWNNWSNGDPGWSCGPPKADSTFRIQDITMYYNTLSSPSS